uniref:Putative integral membrane protein n=1 Tax=Rhodococcus hoagii TaxID=43767 RepID=A0A0F7DB50_RHOHA|nr:hypothetical protein [Prescottella equi]AKG90476.1 putative integral membrane protein [Prescottella equi]
MARDWLTDAQAALTGADDRVTASETRINELLAAPIDPVPLPQQSTIDRTRLPKALAAKLVRREAQGLPVPRHAHNASAIAAPDSSTSDALTGSALTRRQRDALRAQLPHTEDTSGRTDSMLDRFVDAFHASGRLATLRNLLAVVAVGLAAAMLFGPLEPSPSTIAAIAALAWALLFAAVAEERAENRADLALSGPDYWALEHATVAEPGPEPGTPEHQLAQIAAALAAHITACPAWASDDLSVHRIQLDPDAEAAQITAHATEISRARDALGPTPDGDGDAALRARIQRAGNEQILDTVTASLTRRVAALYRYAAELSALNTDYLALQAVERSLTASSHLGNLVRQTGGDELTVRHLDRLTADARDLHAAITTRLQILTGDLTALHELPAGPDDNHA